MENIIVRGSAARTGIPAAILIPALTLAPALPGLAQEASLWSVLVRATHYAEGFQTQLAGVVMEERYQQSASVPPAVRESAGDAVVRVTLRSDYLLVRPEGAHRHFGFRDVFEVNGNRVRDRDERLTRLFLDAGSSLDRRVQGIMADSARYNVGDIRRTTNTPTLALLFLRQSYKRGFAFERVADRAPALGIEWPGGADVWVVSYRETWPTTVVRGNDGRSVPARGYFWIEPATGRVLASELILADAAVESLVAVLYGMPEELGHLVPVEMRESYHNLESGSEVEGTATYSRFRRFQVVVDESQPLRD